jgi:RNA polymerase sigma-70 factor (ECF subfamily)
MILGKTLAYGQGNLSDAASAAGDAIAEDPVEAIFIEQLRSGDADAFDKLILRYSADIYAILFRLMEDREEAADLTQETFLSALKAIKGFRGEASLKTWLTRIAINHSRNRRRWWQRRGLGQTLSIETPVGDGELTLGGTIAGRGESAEAGVLRREREIAIRKILLELPEKFREAVILCDIEGMTYEEIASALEISIGTVKSRISRGREEIRRRLKDF